MTGADLEYSRMLSNAGLSNGAGFDGARLEQLSDTRGAFGIGLIGIDTDGVPYLILPGD